MATTDYQLRSNYQRGIEVAVSPEKSIFVPAYESISVTEAEVAYVQAHSALFGTVLVVTPSSLLPSAPAKAADATPIVEEEAVTLAPPDPEDTTFKKKGAK